jgi:hypothetical protein
VELHSSMEYPWSSLTDVEMSRVQCPSTAPPLALDTNSLYPWQGLFMDAIDGLPEWSKSGASISSTSPTYFRNLSYPLRIQGLSSGRRDWLMGREAVGSSLRGSAEQSSSCLLEQS